MKVALFAPSFPPLSSGGISSSHYNLYLSMKDKFHVRVFTYDEVTSGFHVDHEVCRYGLPSFLIRLIRISIVVLMKISGAKGEVYQFADAFCGALAGLKLLRKVKEFNPDILMIPDHGPVSALWPRLAKGKILFISHHNSMRFHNQPLLGLHSRRDALLGGWLEQRAINKSDVVICPSNYMKEVFQDSYSFEGPVHVVANMIGGIEMETIPPASLHLLLGLPPDAPIVYIPSAGSVYKGRNFVFEIIQRVSHEYARQIGFYLSGALDMEFADFFEHLPSSVRVHAPGPVSYHDNIANMKACKICISPTLLESFGMAILEAQWNGIPAVTFDTGGIGEIVVDKTTGIICPYLDMNALISSSVALLNSEELVGRIGRKALDITRLRFNEEAIVGRYLEIFDQISGVS